MTGVEENIANLAFEFVQADIGKRMLSSLVPLPSINIPPGPKLANLQAESAFVTEFFMFKLHEMYRNRDFGRHHDF
jgi:hypothetical protein